ncbi:MAG: trypsin-like peptidase domain-containing protein [Myxococcota bacterium]
MSEGKTPKAVLVLFLLMVPFSMALGAILVVALQRAITPEPAAPALPTTQAPTAPEPREARPLEPAVVAPRGDLSDVERTTVDIFRNAAPSVVFITKLAVRFDPLRRNAMTRPEGTGSGFLWGDEGHVVTNFHVVAGADGARVTLSDQTVWPAELVGVFPDKDIAVLKIDAPAEKLRPLPVGESGNLEVGQHVFAIGNPFGLDHTLSTGVISGLGREIDAMNGRPIQGVIQTDAAINPGNSGGPLLDSAGRLIGVNTAIYSPSGASAGVGFAVPVDAVARVVPQLIATGRVERPGLGIQVDEGQLAQRLGVRGAVVLGVVPGSGAARAGLRPTVRDPRSGRVVIGDVIVQIDGQPIASTTDLYRAIDRRSVGDTVAVTVLRAGNAESLEVQLTPLP